MTENRCARPALLSSEVLPALLYFALMLAIGVLVRDIALQPALLTRLADFPQALKEFDRVTDPGSFLIAARDIANTGWVAPGNMWVVRLWPPGFMLLEGWILRLGGDSIPFIGVLLVFACLAYTAMLVLTRRLLLQFTNSFAAFALPLIPFAFPFARVFLLEPAGLVLGEGFAIAFFVMGAVLLLSCSQNYRLRKAVWAGALLAASAYFRSQYELLISFLTAAAIPFGIWYWLRTRRSAQDGRAHAPGKNSAIKAMAVSLIAAHVLMAPWRVHNYLDSGSTSWVHTQQLVIRNALATQEELTKMNAWFVMEGGGDLACRFEPEYCGKTEPSLFYKAFFKNIIPWYHAKAQLIGRYWFSSPENLGRLIYPNTTVDIIYSGINLLILALTVPLLVFIRRWNGAPAMYWLQSAFYACFFCIVTFVQFEARYFYLIKFFSTVTFVVLLAVACKMSRSAVRRISLNAAPSLDETK
ncbi:hypothetical protein [Bordetella bronchialis]|nr:hypothetical protein [Bordetella bronchialis]